MLMRRRSFLLGTVGISVTVGLFSPAHASPDSPEDGGGDESSADADIDNPDDDVFESGLEDDYVEPADFLSEPTTEGFLNDIEMRAVGDLSGEQYLGNFDLYANLEYATRDTVIDRNIDVYEQLLKFDLSNLSSNLTEWFACIGGSYKSVLFGICIAAEMRVFVYTGIGTSGVSYQYGKTNDVGGYLSGVSASVARGGIGTGKASDKDSDARAVFAGNNGGAITIGIEVKPYLDTIPGYFGP